MADRCHWDLWDWEGELTDDIIVPPETPGETPPSTACPPAEPCDDGHKPRVDSFLIIPSTIVEVFFEV